MLLKTAKTGFLLTLFFTLFFGGIYPFVTFLIGQAFFPFQTQGSLLFDPQTQKFIGSKLIAQDFSSPKYFTPRPCEAHNPSYNAMLSGGSELGPTSKKLLEDVLSRADRYRQFNALQADICIPIDAVTISASNLDPHISVMNALLQVPRVSQARQLSVDELMELVQKYTERPFFGLIGEPRINVLMLNLALDHKIVEKEQ
jgi:K+-transporting ATPase ATPase C chain